MTDAISNFLKTIPALKALLFALSIFIVYSYFLTIYDIANIDHDALTAPPSKNLFTKMSSALPSIREFKIEPKPAIIAFLVASFSFWVNTFLYRSIVMLSAPALSQQSHSLHKNITLAYNDINTTAKRWNEEHNRKTLSNAFHCCASLYTFLILSIIDIFISQESIIFAMFFALLISLTTAYMWIIIIRYVMPCSILRLKKPLTYIQIYTLLRDINS